MQVDAKATELEAMFRASPMIAFSPTSYMQQRGLNTLGQEIESLLDSMWNEPRVMNENGMLATLRFWLWILGSYEPARSLRVRTAKDGFQDLSDRFREFERFIKPLRMVMAKQEFAGKPGSDAWRDAISKGLTKDERDFVFEVPGASYTMRGSIAEFERVFGSISFADIKPVIERNWRLHEGKPPA